eukprot:3319088-Rhodomonas_salina.1
MCPSEREVSSSMCCSLPAHTPLTLSHRPETNACSFATLSLSPRSRSLSLSHHTHRHLPHTNTPRASENTLADITHLSDSATRAKGDLNLTAAASAPGEGMESLERTWEVMGMPRSCMSLMRPTTLPPARTSSTPLTRHSPTHCTPTHATHATAVPELSLIHISEPTRPRLI